MDGSSQETIEDSPFNHGIRRTKDVERLLKSPGDFLIRKSERYGMAITVMDDRGHITNIRLGHEDGGWYIAERYGNATPCEKFPTLHLLIDHYRIHPPSNHLHLATPILRPQWSIEWSKLIYEEKGTIGDSNGYKGKLTRLDGMVLSVAVCRVKDTDSIESKTAIEKEARLLSYLVHPNIVQYFGVSSDRGTTLIVKEECTGGSLHAHLVKNGSETECNEKLLYLYETACGLGYLHKQKIVHLRLDARNCFISSTGIIKIGGYGFAAFRSDREPLSTSTRWCAPESPSAVSPAFDCYSFGVLLFEIFYNGVMPWKDLPYSAIADRLQKGELPELLEDTPSRLVLLAGCLLSAEPSLRPKMKNVKSNLHLALSEYTALHGPFTASCLTINRIPGVKRVALKDFIDQRNDLCQEMPSKDCVDMRSSLCTELQSKDVSSWAKSEKQPPLLSTSQESTMREEKSETVRKENVASAIAKPEMAVDVGEKAPLLSPSDVIKIEQPKAQQPYSDCVKSEAAPKKKEKCCPLWCC